MKPSYRTNIYCLYLIKLSKWLMLIMPIVALFYAENGLNTFDIYLLQATYSLSVALFEIPSGYLADVIGRKKTLVFGSFLGTIGMLVMSSSFYLPGFMAAQIILGLGGSCISGSDSALLYDSLAAEQRQHYYLRYEGRITALGNLAETAAAVGGGLIAAWLSYRSVYVTQTVIAAIAIPASLLLLEPERERLASHPSLRQILSISHQSLLVNHRLGAAILISGVAGTATLCMAWTCQIYFVTVGFTEVQITPLWVLLNLTVAAVSAAAARVVETLGARRAIVIMIVVMPLGYILLGALPLIPALAALYLFYLVRGYATPMLRDLINTRCGSAERATVLSIRSLLVRFSFALAGPAIGLVSEHHSLQFALVLFGLVLSLSFLLAGRALARSEHIPTG